MDKIISCVVAGLSAGIATFVVMLCVAALLKYLRS